MAKIKKTLIGLSLILNLITVILLIFLLYIKNFNISYFIDRAVHLLNNKKSIGLNVYYDSPYWQQKVSQFTITNIIQSRSNAKKILFIGDSITENFRIEQFLTDTFKDMRVFNHGISGDTTSGVLKRIDKDLDTLKPDQLFIMLGINDFLAGFSIEQVIENYKEIIQKVRKRRIPLFIQSTLYTRTAINLNSSVDSLNKKLKIFCKEKCIYIDLNSKLHSRYLFNNDYTWDGIHLNADSYRIWFDTISHYLKDGE